MSQKPISYEIALTAYMIQYPVRTDLGPAATLQSELSVIYIYVVSVTPSLSNQPMSV